MAGTRTPRRHIKRPYELAAALRGHAPPAGTHPSGARRAGGHEPPLGLRRRERQAAAGGSGCCAGWCTTSATRSSWSPAPEPDLDLEAHVASLADPALPGL